MNNFITKFEHGKIQVHIFDTQIFKKFHSGAPTK